MIDKIATGELADDEPRPETEGRNLAAAALAARAEKPLRQGCQLSADVNCKESRQDSLELIP